MKKFPDDCNRKCPYFNCYDLSVGDYVYQCRKMNIQVDIGWTMFSCNCPLETIE